MKTQLTIEQSERLLELGVSFERASERTPDYTDINNTGRPLERRELSPIFTLTDILDLLPKEIEVDSPNVDGSIDIDDCYLCTQWCTNGYYADNHQWRAFYTPGFRLIKECTSPELIDALYSLLVWCLEKGYVK